MPTETTTQKFTTFVDTINHSTTQKFTTSVQNKSDSTTQKFAVDGDFTSKFLRVYQKFQIDGEFAPKFLRAIQKFTSDATPIVETVSQKMSFKNGVLNTVRGRASTSFPDLFYNQTNSPIISYADDDIKNRTYNNHTIVGYENFGRKDYNTQMFVYVKGTEQLQTQATTDAIEKLRNERQFRTSEPKPAQRKPQNHIPIIRGRGTDHLRVNKKDENEKTFDGFYSV